MAALPERKEKNILDSQGGVMRPIEFEAFLLIETTVLYFGWKHLLVLELAIASQRPRTSKIVGMLYALLVVCGIFGLAIFIPASIAQALLARMDLMTSWYHTSAPLLPILLLHTLATAGAAYVCPKLIRFLIEEEYRSQYQAFRDSH